MSTGTDTAGLSFRRIEIRRMPGFPSGGFPVDDLCPGVNIVYGPNASGKTTLGRAIQKLLRPTDGPHDHRSLRAALELRGESWTIDYDVGRVGCQRNGAEAELPPLAPAEVQDHYVLALHDLLGAEDGADLAAEIVRQSAGGYDVAAARGLLGYRDRPSGKGKATRELDEAVAARKEALRKQDDLVEEERELAALRTRRDEARAAAGRLELLAKALQHHQAAAADGEAAERLQTFPAGLAKMAGNETARLEELDPAIESAANDRRDEESLRQAAQKRVADSGLPEAGVPGELLSALRQKCQRLRSLAGDLPKKREEAKKTAARVVESRKNLGPGVDPQQAARLDTTVVAKLADFARRAETLRAQVAAAKTLEQWLDSDPQGPPQPAETLNEGVRLLNRWIATREGPGADGPRRKLVPMIAAAAVLVVSLLMALVAHWSWLLLLPVAFGLALWALVPRVPTDRGAELRGDFESLGVGEPSDWTAAGVRAFAHQLQQRAAEAALRKERNTRWGDLADNREELEKRRKDARGQKDELVAELGIGLDVAETDETWLSALAANLQRLQEAEETAAAAAAAASSAETACRELLAEVRAALRPFRFEETDDPDLVAEQVEELARRQQELDKARTEVDTRAQALEGIEKRLGDLAGKRAALFAGLGLEQRDEATLRQWARQYADYQEAAGAVHLAERDLGIARAALTDWPDLLTMPRETLEAEREACQGRADELESLNQRIGGIEANIKAAKQSTALETAIARVQSCTEALRLQREADYGAVSGHVLAEFLARHERDRERPGVFQQARKLFVQITHGRYRLDIDPGDPPGFRAFDTSRETGLALDELSSGTRLQLLLSVRVAFVQRQERGLKLPLIFDETLGNSDERRAEQIIDAVIEICRGGRQVFYLTAQHDEVGKWRAMLKRHADVPWHITDLAEIRQFSEAERVPPMDIPPQPEPEVPPPGDLDWLAYGRLLNVPPLDPRGQLGGVHLWYLIDDLPTLYRLLRGGINRWGQLQTLAGYGDDPSLRATSPVYRRAEAAGRLIEAASRWWRVGRGRPVDRQVLDECPAVTATFLDRVCDLAAEVSGNAKLLIARLEAGHAKGFRTDKRNELQEYLAEQGYLDQREPLSPDEIRPLVRPLVFSDLDSGLLSPERLEQLLAMICRA